MSIRKHIFSALLFVLALTFISFGTSIYYLNKIGSTSTQILQEDYQVVKAAEELIISLAKLDRALVMLCLDRDVENDEAGLLKIVTRERKVISNYLVMLKERIGSENARLLFNELSENYRRYERNLDRIPTTRDRDALYLSLLRWQNEVTRLSCTSIVEEHHALLKQKNDILQELYLSAKINTFLASVLVLLIAGVVLDKIPSRIIRPILELTERVKRIALNDSGVPEQDIPMKPNSELAELAKSIKIAGRRLKETEEKFWLITKNLYDIIFFCTPEGKIFYTTPSIQPVLGYTSEEMIGKQPLELLHPKDIHQTKPELAARERVNSEIRLKTKKGDYLWLEVSYTFHRDEQGTVLYTQYTARDISKRKEAEENIKKALVKEKALNEALTKTNQELDQLVYSASHNLRSPLTSVLGLVSLLKLASRKQERLELIDQVEDSIHRLDETIKEIIDYSRNDRTELQITQIDFEEIIVETIRDLQFMQSPEHPVEISYEIDPAVHCHSDAGRLEMIFLNLVSNAIKYHNPDQAKAMLRISVVQKRGKTIIAFEDNGIGIQERLHEKVFNMFYRASEKASGAGLGLYIAKCTITKLGGTISINSVFEQGTTVTLTIPDLKKMKISGSGAVSNISSPEAWGSATA